MSLSFAIGIKADGSAEIVAAEQVPSRAKTAALDAKGYTEVLYLHKPLARRYACQPAPIKPTTRKK